MGRRAVEGLPPTVSRPRNRIRSAGRFETAVSRHSVGVRAFSVITEW